MTRKKKQLTIFTATIIGIGVEILVALLWLFFLHIAGAYFPRIYDVLDLEQTLLPMLAITSGIGAVIVSGIYCNKRKDLVGTIMLAIFLTGFGVFASVGLAIELRFILPV